MTAKNYTPFPPAPEKPEATSQAFNSRFQELDDAIEAKASNSGHKIVYDDNELEQRSAIELSGGIMAEDDSVNERTHFRLNYDNLDEETGLTANDRISLTVTRSITKTIKTTLAALGAYFGSLFLPKSGGTMTGMLTLYTDPVNLMDAATKKYVDENASGGGGTGQNAYVHIKYSAYANPTDAQVADAPDKYMGVYSGTSSTAPITASSYKWGRIQGEDGGTGQNAYVHIKYSAYANPTDAQVADAPDKYMGVYSGTSSTAPDTASSYKWGQIKGNDAVPPTLVIDTSSATTFALSDATEFRRGQVATLTLTLPATIPDDYIAVLAFTSGSTASMISGSGLSSVKFSGDDVTNGVYAPAPNKRYNILFWWDGVYTNAIVRGA